MNDFELNKIGNKMPYAAPSEDFFVDFTDELMTKIENAEPKVFSLRRLFAPMVSIAAVAAVVLTLTLGFEDKSRYVISDNLDESVDSFFENLSDEELTLLASENACQDDFYYALPNN